MARCDSASAKRHLPSTGNNSKTYVSTSFGRFGATLTPKRMGVRVSLRLAPMYRARLTQSRARHTEFSASSRAPHPNSPPTSSLEEVEKAKSFHPKLAKWTLAHSGRKDVELEQLAREITAQHREQGLFSVELLAWDDDIQSLLEQYPDVIARHYPEQAPASLAMAMVAAKLSQGDDDTPIDPTIAKCRSAASRANAAFLSDDAVKPADLKISVPSQAPCLMNWIKRQLTRVPPA